MIAAPSISSPSRPTYSVPDVTYLRNKFVGRPWQSYEEGLKHLQRPEQAKKCLNDAVRFTTNKSKKDAALFANFIGAELGERGYYNEALPFIQKALSLDPALPIAHNNLGILLGELKRYGEAEGEYREAIRLDPALAAAHNNLGILLNELKRYVEAEGESREAIRLDPNYPLPHNNLGILLAELKRYGEAEREYREAIRLDPNYPAAHNNLGLVLYRQGRYEDSEKEYKKAIELEPNKGEAHINLAVLLSATNRHGEAEKEFKEALRLFEKEGPEKLKEAVEYLEKESEVLRDSYSLWRAKGEFLKALGREAEAKKSLERAEFYEAIRYFEANKEGLLRQYEGKFVAILHDEVVDSDEDFEALGERIIKKFGSRDILVRRVTKEPEVIYISTPFLVQ